MNWAWGKCKVSGELINLLQTKLANFSSKGARFHLTLSFWALQSVIFIYPSINYSIIKSNDVLYFLTICGQQVVYHVCCLSCC